MKCVVPGGNVKVLAKAIHMLAKIGDEMYVNPQQESISFRTVNMAKSAYSDFTFHKNFFSYYILGNLNEEEAQKCKISMRSAMTVFKSAHLLDKQVETCHICLDVDSCDLIFILKYKNGVNKSYLSPILDSEKLQASYIKTGMANELMSRARTLMDAVQNFQQNLIEITLEVTPQKLLLRNYVDDGSFMANTTRTQLALGIGEFDRYTIGNETTITFCLKEFKALLTFSESVGVPVSTYFETTGRPVLFILKNQGFEMNLLLSTLSPESDSQSDISVVSRKQMRPAPKKSSVRSTSRQKKKSSNCVKKSVMFTRSMVNNTLNNTTKQIEKNNHTTKQTDNASTNMEIDENNSKNKSTEKIKNNSTEQRNSFAISPVTSTTSSSTIRKKIPETHKKLVNTVFSSITKRKFSTNNEDSCIEDLDQNILSSQPHSPSHQISKKARLVFKKCFQTTFDPRMLPGHDVILAEDSDGNNSD